MKKDKLNQLFQLGRQSPAPSPSADFKADVMRAIRTGERSPAPSASLADQLTTWLPRVAWSTALIIGLCALAEFSQGAWPTTNPDESLAQSSEQAVFPAEGF